MMTDLMGPMWDDEFVLIGIRLTRKPGWKRSFGQTIFDILNALRYLEITLPWKCPQSVSSQLAHYFS